MTDRLCQMHEAPKRRPTGMCKISLPLSVGNVSLDVTEVVMVLSVTMHTSIIQHNIIL